MTAEKLFRAEALEVHRSRLAGDVVLRSSYVWWLLSLAVAFFVVAIVALMVWGQYTRRVAVEGYLIPQGGVLRVFSGLPGRVGAVYVNEGDKVLPGQGLLSVVDERPDALGLDARRAAARQAIARQQSLDFSLKQQEALFAQQKQGLEQRVAALEREILLLTHEQETQARRTLMAEKTLQRWQLLARDQFVSENAVQEKLEMVTEQKARMQAAERALVSLQKERVGLQSELASLPIRHAMQVSEIARNRSQVAQELIELESRRELLITSPRAGTVAGLTAKLGQTVSTERTLMTILPADEAPQASHQEGATHLMQEMTVNALEAHLFVPSRDAGFVRAGQTVQIRYSAYPYQKFGHHQATVLEVSQTPLLTSELPYPLAGVGAAPGAGGLASLAGIAALGAAASTSEPVYRVRAQLAQQTVQAYGQKQSLQSGMQLEADIMLDTRSIMEWILEPIYSIRGKYFQ